MSLFNAGNVKVGDRVEFSYPADGTGEAVERSVLVEVVKDNRIVGKDASRGDQYRSFSFEKMVPKGWASLG